VLLFSVFLLASQSVTAADQDREMMQILQKAQAGNIDAQTSLGYLYHSLGKDHQDFQTAIRWYKQAAMSGHPHAAFALGLMYEHGQGTRRDPDQARQLYLQAANIYRHRGAAVPYKLALDALARL